MDSERVLFPQPLLQRFAQSSIKYLGFSPRLERERERVCTHMYTLVPVPLFHPTPIPIKMQEISIALGKTKL